MQRVVKMPNTSSYFRTKDVENARALNGQIGNLVGPFRIVKESQNGKSFWTTVDLGEGEPAWKPVNDFADALCAKMSATPDAPAFNDEPLMPDFGA